MLISNVLENLLGWALVSTVQINNLLSMRLSLNPVYNVAIVSNEIESVLCGSQCFEGVDMLWCSH